jgi:hypothetical protein
MKKLLLIMLSLLLSFNIVAQEAKKEKVKKNIFKEFYQDFLKYGTIYAAGDIKNAYENSRKEYFVERPADGDLYAIPNVIEVTEYFPFDYRYGVGIRKLGRFDYERKPGNFWTGNQYKVSQQALSSPTSAVAGFEYLFHFEKERLRGEEWNNFRYFIRHTGKYHIAKIESRSQGAFDFEYKSAEVRGRLPIGKKFSISAGAIYRTHTKAYGYNPIEIWLNETNDSGHPVNPWYTLGFDYGYTDHYTTYTDNVTGNQTYDWIWKDENGNIVAYSDIDFRNGVFGDLMNRYNNEQWDLLAPFGVISPIIGADFYHYKNKFWLHAYANYLPGFHKYLSGDKNFTYLNRDNYGVGGLVADAEPKQWEDYQAGINFGWKIGKNLGIFAEGEYNKMWDTKFFNSTFGINFTFR